MPESEQVVVREAVLADLEGLAGLLAELHPRYPADRRVSATVLQDILRCDTRTLLVAAAGDEVVGTADIVIVANLTHAGHPWAIIENVVVRAARQGQGIGRALFADSLRRAEEAGCYMVQLLSLRHRRAAHAFYQSLGFEPVAEGFRHYFDGFAPTTEHDSTGRLRSSGDPAR